jgi:drug/metabolite transporter (DMT)-like permease
LLPRILLTAAVVIWGWTFVATKILLAELGPIEILALRLAIGTPFLAVVLLANRMPLGFARADLAPLVGGGVIFTLHFLVQIAGLETTTAVNSGWLIALSPLALAVLSFLLLGERIGRRGVAGIFVATCGVLLLVSRGRITDLGWLGSTGDWLVLLSAHTWALYTVATRDLSRRRNPLAVTVAVLLIATALTAIAFAVGGDVARVRALSPRGIAALLYLAIPGLALAQWFWQVGVAKLGAARSGLFLYLEPIATLALAIPLLGEPFGPFGAFGGGLVLAGVWLGQRPARSAPRPLRTEPSPRAAIDEG